MMPFDTIFPDIAENDVGVIHALDHVNARIRKMVAADGAGARFVTTVLGKELGL